MDDRAPARFEAADPLVGRVEVRRRRDRRRPVDVVHPRGTDLADGRLLATAGGGDDGLEHRVSRDPVDVQHGLERHPHLEAPAAHRPEVGDGVEIGCLLGDDRPEEHLDDRARHRQHFGAHLGVAEAGVLRDLGLVVAPEPLDEGIHIVEDPLGHRRDGTDHPRRLAHVPEA